jgi:hypothetical protein
MAVVAPMPTASVNTAMNANPRERASERRARHSWVIMGAGNEPRKPAKVTDFSLLIPDESFPLSGFLVYAE